MLPPVVLRQLATRKKFRSARRDNMIQTHQNAHSLPSSFTCRPHARSLRKTLAMFPRVKLARRERRDGRLWMTKTGLYGPMPTRKTFVSITPGCVPIRSITIQMPKTCLTQMLSHTLKNTISALKRRLQTLNWLEKHMMLVIQSMRTKMPRESQIRSRHHHPSSNLPRRPSPAARARALKRRLQCLLQNLLFPLAQALSLPKRLSPRILHPRSKSPRQRSARGPPRRKKQRKKNLLLSRRLSLRPSQERRRLRLKHRSCLFFLTSGFALECCGRHWFSLSHIHLSPYVIDSIFKRRTFSLLATCMMLVLLVGLGIAGPGYGGKNAVLFIELRRFLIVQRIIHLLNDFIFPKVILVWLLLYDVDAVS